MSQARARTRSARSGVERANHKTLLAVHTDFILVRRRDLENNDNIETVMVEICQTLKDNILFGVCYRPPSSDVEFLLKLRQCLERIEMTRFAMCYLVGDFNFPSIDWHSLTATSIFGTCLMIIFWFNVILILTKTPDLVSMLKY